MKLLTKSLALLGATSLLVTTGHAAHVLEYEYNGTPVRNPNPTLDTSGGGPVANGTMAANVDYAPVNSTNPNIGTGSSSAIFTAADGTGINFTTTGASILNNVPGATLFTDFMLTSNITGSTPRLLYVSNNLAGGASARAEIRLDNVSTGVSSGVYTFRTAGRVLDTTLGFFTVTSDQVTLNLNQWYSLGTALDFTGKTISIFLNGADIVSGSEAAAFSANTTPNTNSVAALIGTNGQTGNLSYSGLLDNTRIYGTALTGSQIAAISVPEPTTAVMLLGGFGMLGLLRRRSRR